MLEIEDSEASFYRSTEGKKGYKPNADVHAIEAKELSTRAWMSATYFRVLFVLGTAWQSFLIYHMRAVGYHASFPFSLPRVLLWYFEVSYHDAVGSTLDDVLSTF